jgi:hypothetical protein
VDGTPVGVDGIPLAADGQRHEVVVRMGSRAAVATA